MASGEQSVARNREEICGKIASERPKFPLLRLSRGEWTGKFNGIADQWGLACGAQAPAMPTIRGMPYGAGFMTLIKMNNFLFGRSMGALVAGAMVLGSCGGGGSPTPSPSPSPTATPTPTPTTSACSLRSRQDWVLAQLNEWYLFPSLFNSAANPASYTDVQSYVDALVAPARAQNRDRYFTYITSIAEENAYYESGDTAGFGFRLGYDTAARRVFVLESFEGAPALGANIDRGDEIVMIGTGPSNLAWVSNIMASGGPDAVFEALGPSTVGTSRLLRVRSRAGVERDVRLTKTNYALDPVSDRFGATVFTEGARKIGYLNLRTFIDTANADMRTAFAMFRAQGVTELIVDFRYNGGGLISTAELLNNLMGLGRGGQVQGRIAFRDSKSAENETFLFAEQPESIQPLKVAFIGTGGTASASEMVINTFVPHLGANMALIGSNTYGKPVGQIALDRPECDDRLRAVAIKIENSANQGEYYNGLAGIVSRTCRADDDITRPLGDPNEAMIRVALDFLAGRSCSAITATASATASTARVGGGSGLLSAPGEQASTFQREVPGAY